MPDSPVLGLRYAADNLPSDEPSDTLYITGLPSPSVDEDDLKLVFVSLGLTVRRLETIPDTEDAGTSAAIVQVASQDEASRASWGASAASAGGARVTTLQARYAGQDPSTPSDNIYLNGLPGTGVSQDALNQVFIGLGCQVVRSRIMPDTKGFGSCAAMVQVASQEQAALAIEALSGAPSTTFLQHSDEQTSQMASPMEMDPSAGQAGKPLILRYAGQAEMPSDNLYITNLPSPSVEQADLVGVFETLGLNVVRSRILPDTKGIGCSSAMVQVGSQEQAAKAIEVLHGQDGSALARNNNGAL